MTELLLETATDVCSVAVARNGQLLAEVTAKEVHQHASHLTVFIQRALDEAGVAMHELDEVVLSDGPGSYTSLRIGAATAKGLCLALPRLRFSVVSTLSALATAASHSNGEDKIMATINSRRGEVFGRLFTVATVEPLTEVMNVRLTDPRWRGKLLDGEALGRIAVCGPGQGRVADAIENDNTFSFSAPKHCSASYLLAPARRRPDVAAYEPFYLNAPFVTQSKKKALL